MGSALGPGSGHCEGLRGGEQTLASQLSARKSPLAAPVTGRARDYAGQSTQEIERFEPTARSSHDLGDFDLFAEFLS